MSKFPEPTAPADAEEPAPEEAPASPDSDNEDAAKPNDATLSPPAVEPIAPVIEEPAADATQEPVPGTLDEPSSYETSTLATSAKQTRRVLDIKSKEKSAWTDPAPVFSLDGYFRVRGELQDAFSLGRQTIPGEVGDPPFDAFRPVEDGAVVSGGCGDNPGDSRCSGNTLSYTNMRLRLMPHLNVNEDIRLHMWVDALDNVVWGSTPDSFSSQPGLTGAPAGSANFPLDSFSSTALPPQGGQNSTSDSLVVRRAWAEVRDRDIGELRFGRMGFHWGLGMLYNEGANFDGDYSTDVDRVLATSKLAGLYWMAAYDFPAEGLVRQVGPSGVPHDAAQKDDVDQIMLAVTHRVEPEEQQERLQQGKIVLEGGFNFLHRSQLLSMRSDGDPWLREAEPELSFVRRGADTYTEDLWVKFLYDTMRIELEAAVVLGSLENTQVDTYQEENYNIFQLGIALEFEYRLLDEKLGLHFASGFASGDSDVEGLSAQDNSLSQLSGDDTISTFGFHPNYRVDLILWRNVMRRVAGAYYFKPGISYDFIRSGLGHLMGLRLDVIWSRASTPVQTWGNDPDLGVELDAALYYQSEDGPGLTDGFHAALQYGVLFPMQGLGYLPGQFPNDTPDLETAQALRLLLGVVF